MKGRFLVDSNVLIYSTLRNDSRYAKACEVVAARNLPGCQMYISAQNLAEMFPNLTGPKTQPPDSPAIARAKIASIAGLDRCLVLPVTRLVVEKALELCERHHVTRQRYFDCQLAATMLLEGIPEIVTENESDFASIPGIHVINPFR